MNGNARMLAMASPVTMKKSVEKSRLSIQMVPAMAAAMNEICNRAGMGKSWMK